VKEGNGGSVGTYIALYCNESSKNVYSGGCSFKIPAGLPSAWQEIFFAAFSLLGDLAFI
jgi:Na+/alanine symporter